ncbi:MAG: diphosphomevalonate decarboxylase [bacterium]|nr:diphosphomevalonate decarboxylase [bacterium]
MSNKATIRCPSNIAFIKYWGARDLARAIPVNPSISMTLRSCFSRSTVEWLDEDGEHEIRWRAAEGGLETAPPAFADRVRRHLDFLREWSGQGGRFRVATENSFPSAAGLASSASGFSALTLAVLGALDRQVSPAEQSALARLSGSGSASRSVMGGYVEWPAEGEGEGGSECHAHQLATAEHWDLRNVIAVVERGAKKTSSLDGHRRAETSPYFCTRQACLPERLEAVRRAIEERDFLRLGEVVEAEAIDLHCVAMTSTPAIFYWRPATLLVLEAVREMREDGVAAYSTMDAGANVHVICTPESEIEVAARLSRLDLDLSLIHDGVGNGPVVEPEHLF